MSCRILRSLALPCLISLGLSATTDAVHAGPLDITTFTANDATTVSFGAGTAKIGENQAIPSVDLSKVFLIPSGAKTLTFTITNLTTDPNLSNTLPPFFAADLRDTLGVSLVPVTPGPPSNDFYTRDLTSPLFTAASAAGVTVTPSDSSTAPITVTLDISSIPVGTTADLVFSVFPDGDNASTGASVTIAGVNIDTGIATIPEPASLVLLSMGVMGLAGHVWRRRRKQIIVPK